MAIYQTITPGVVADYDRQEWRIVGTSKDDPSMLVLETTDGLCRRTCKPYDIAPAPLPETK